MERAVLAAAAASKEGKETGYFTEIAKEINRESGKYEEDAG